MFTKANVESREKGNAGFHDWHLLMPYSMFYKYRQKKLKMQTKTGLFLSF